MRTCIGGMCWGRLEKQMAGNEEGGVRRRWGGTRVVEKNKKEEK